MNIIGVQIVLVFFGLFMMYILFLHWKKKNISNITFTSWMVIWIIFIFFAFFPLVLEPLTEKLFIIRVMDLGMIGAFMVLTYLTIENNIKINKFNKMIETLVRKMSINKNK